VTEARYLLDEHLWNALASGLRLRSIDAITVHEAGRRSASDRDHLAWAIDNGRVIVTHDDDYLALAARVERHAGIPFCKADKYTLGGLLREIEILHAELTAEDWANRVVFL
jgi:hypothetical protein